MIETILLIAIGVVIGLMVTNAIRGASAYQDLLGSQILVGKLSMQSQVCQQKNAELAQAYQEARGRIAELEALIGPEYFEDQQEEPSEPDLLF